MANTFDSIQHGFISGLTNNGYPVEVLEVGDTVDNWYMAIKVGDLILKLEDISDEADMISVNDQVDLLEDMVHNSCKCGGSCKDGFVDLKTHLTVKKNSVRY